MLTASCTLLMPPARSAPAPAEAAAAPFATAWVAGDSVALDIEGGEAVSLDPFTRLDVVALSEGRLRVRCDVCPDPRFGTVAVDEVVTRSLYPQPASYADLSTFALAIRSAAERRDLRALRSVMAPDFTYSFIGPQTRDAALDVWRAEGFQALDAVPGLLDSGLGTTEGRIWSAPLEYRTDLAYRGYRVGFRRNEVGRWEWLYLIRGIAP